jgi:methylthioribose-1-phosphate isomerase
MKINKKLYETIWYEESQKNVYIIDQTKLPHQFLIKNLKTARDAINAIKVMEVRGAPLIGATAAYGIFLAIKEKKDKSFIKDVANDLINTRPTAINLKWSVERMLKKLNNVNENKILDAALDEANKICEEDKKFCEKIGLYGLKIIEKIYKKKKKTVNILTHCNAGWLATIDWGTATSPIYHAHKKGIPVHVWVDETRPRNQGANLTSYELNEEEIPNTIIADNTGGILMQRGEVDMCIVGTDRTLSNGDVCNKIGTYLKALAAYDNNVPFYVTLPSSTIDWDIKEAKDIPIEQRNSEELSHVEGVDENNKIKKVLIYPKNSKAMNLAFDVTPAKYVTGLITEKGITEASSDGLKKLFKK